MNQVEVCSFEPKFCQNVATASRNPLDPLWTPTPKAAALWGAPPVQFTLVQGSGALQYSSVHCRWPERLVTRVMSGTSSV